jgi:rSAM/selenodomain-associated transferase 1
MWKCALNDALLVFARYPRLGQVKTRLGSIYTPQECLALHEAFTLDTLERTALLSVDRTAFFAGCEKERAELYLHRNNFEDVGVECQAGDDLGERMWNAWRKFSSEYSRVVIVGTDAPTVPLQHIRAAFRVLEEKPVVLGPVSDGGYYLIGMSRGRKELFFDIPWGTSRVFEQTVARLSPCEYALLPVWYDIDLPEDLRRLAQDLKEDFEGYPARTGALIQSLLI